MPNRILKSTLLAANIDPEMFASHVENFVNEQQHHAEHMKRVEADSKLPPPIKPDFRNFRRDPEKFDKASQDYEMARTTRHQAYPAPVAHALIAAALEGDGKFEIVNDDANVKAAQLAAAKNELIQRVLRDESAQIEQVFPLSKRRVFQYQEQDIRKQDQSKWSDADRKFVESQEAKRADIEEVQRTAAQLLSEIGDLTDETIMDWTKNHLGATAS